MSTTAFITESPLRTARRYVDAELRGTARPADIAWLHANPLMWLRALQHVARDVQNHTAKRRTNLAQLKPKPGEAPSVAYIEAKQEFETQNVARLHFAALVERRIDEVKAVIAPGPVPFYVTLGDLIEAFTDIATLADENDLAAAADKAMFHAKRLKKIAKGEQS